MQMTEKDNNIYQNLLDAGCNAEMAEQYEKLAKTENWSKLLNKLAKQKKHLLSALHESEKQIDCLDFLVYEINKKHKGEFRNESPKINTDKRMG